MGENDFTIVILIGLCIATIVVIAFLVEKSKKEK